MTLESSARAEAVLASLPPAAFADPASRAAWHGCGLRVLRVPDTELSRVRGMLEGPERVPGSVTRQWLAPGAGWVEAVRERGSAEPRVVALHDSRFRAAPGWLRLLARCWPEPVMAEPGAEGEGGSRVESVLRVELVPQAADGGELGADPDAAWERTLRPAATRPRRAEDQGLLISRLHGAVLVRPGEALAIVYESPEVEWRGPSSGAMTPEVPPPAAGTESGAAQQEAESVPAAIGEVRRGAGGAGGAGGTGGESGGRGKPGVASSGEGRGQASGERPGFGPGPAPLFRVPLLGELILGEGPEPGTARRVLLIVPRGGREFRLLPG